MSRNDEIGNLDFQDIFLALNCHIWYKIYSTSESESSVQASSSRAGSKIASFRFWGPAWPSSPWFQFIITVKDRKEVKLSVVVCCCLLLSVVVSCCLLLSVVVCCLLLLLLLLFLLDVFTTNLNLLSFTAFEFLTLYSCWRWAGVLATILHLKLEKEKNIWCHKILYQKEKFRTLKIVAIFLSFRDIISLVKILAPDANHIIIP